MSLLDQMRLHGRHYTDTLDGGVALHANLEEHLSKEQYLKVLDIAIKEGTSYFTFNIPNSSCDKCGYITKSPIKKCPKCGGEDITWWTRIIGYLRPVKGFSKGRRVEAAKRIYNKPQC
ncbi:MAG: anaerobic ribonucleoside-triphosphate reductase [Rikenellaceae bacterium]